VVSPHRLRSAFHGRATPRVTGRRRHSRLRARRFTRRRAQHQRAVSCNQSTYTGLRAARESYQFYNCSSRVLPFNVSSRLCLRHVDTDMRKRTRSSIAVMEAELAEAQCAAQRAQEALPGFRIALAAFMEQQARWFRCALTSDVPANESGPAAQERFRMERCWCTVEAAAANMGEDFSLLLPVPAAHASSYRSSRVGRGAGRYAARAARAAFAARAQ
jgi:hypothetical protein